MKTKGLCILCTLLLGTSLVLADVSPEKSTKDVATAKSAATLQATTNVSSPGVNAFVEKGEPWVAGDALRDANRPGAVDCPEPYLCGQDETGNTWLYSDMAFSSGGNSGRITSDQFPPPREALLTKAVGIVSFLGT